MRTKVLVGFVGGFVSALFLIALASSQLLPSPAEGIAETLPTVWGSAQAVSQTGTESRDVYYPGTETLAADEMRVVALGTGMPSPHP